MISANNLTAWIARHILGNKWLGLGSCIAAVAWVAYGPLCDYSEKWLMIAGAVSAIITTPAVFLLQNTQDRDTSALQAKVDELIRVTDAARNELIGLEKRADG